MCFRCASRIYSSWEEASNLEAHLKRRSASGGASTRFRCTSTDDFPGIFYGLQLVWSTKFTWFWCKINLLKHIWSAYSDCSYYTLSDRGTAVIQFLLNYSDNKRHQTFFQETDLFKCPIYSGRPHEGKMSHDSVAVIAGLNFTIWGLAIPAKQMSICSLFALHRSCPQPSTMTLWAQTKI